TSAGSIPDLSMQASWTAPSRSAGWSVDSPPPRLPIGLRTASTITTSVMAGQPTAGCVVAIRAVFFDAGETLFDETRSWSAWADWLGVPRLTLLASLGVVLARGEHHTKAFELVRPGIDIERERAAREAAGDVTG